MCGLIISTRPYKELCGAEISYLEHYGQSIYMLLSDGRILSISVPFDEELTGGLRVKIFQNEGEIRLYLTKKQPKHLGWGYLSDKDIDRINEACKRKKEQTNRGAE